MKHVIYTFYLNTNTEIPFEINFYKHNQEHFVFLCEKEDFSAVQGDVLVSQKLVLLEEESSPCLPLRRTERGFLLNLPSPNRQTLLVKWNINAWSENSIHIQLIISPIEFEIFQISRHLIPACVQVFLCTYTWKQFVPHFMCSLLVGGNWNSRQMVVQELLPLKQQ